MSQERKIRVLLAKVGLDGHEKGVVVVARALRDAGMEVIYLGRRQSIDSVIAASLQERVDVIGLSSLSDSHMSVVPIVIEKMKSNGMDDVLLILGGFIQDEDVPVLKDMGVAEVFGVGTPLNNIVEYIKTHVKQEV